MTVILLIQRIAIGLFFAISGIHKLVNKQRHATLVATFRDLHIPNPGFMQWFVPCVELFAGLGVMTGTLTPLASLGLMAICLVALITDGSRRIKAMHPIDRADRLDDYLYLPETLLLLLLLYPAFYGAGLFSVDYAIWSILK